MVYPQGLAKNSTCMAEYDHLGSGIVYTLPLRSCNTMSHDTPHRKLVTSQGRGFHVRCKYQKKNKIILSGFNVRRPSLECSEVKADVRSMIGTTPLVSSAPLPACHMKIYLGNLEDRVVAEDVKIGDYLSLAVYIDSQGVYGMKVTNCLVRDGLNWAEQPLINNDGCPVDEDIMGPFEYSENKTFASVTFPAHKFPYTSSVYYQCNVKLCLMQAGGCDQVPPLCDGMGGLQRRKRQVGDTEVQERGNLQALLEEEMDAPHRNVEVVSALRVNEVDEAAVAGDQSAATAGLFGLGDSDLSSTPAEEDFCVSTRKFAVGIAVAGVLLMLAVLLLVACILRRRRRRKGGSSGSSLYSGGPYSNHGYTRD
ncbi:hypothetical protein LAZ67_8002193 [Cordylochernes scorpioides]|uniref:ZP domain-containing protein n=1 Tax=Cordylochernes scorpioides TaxID=51811 RepID=A0ABY6KUG0_9ARAC|nr:hypothetical protein LAZ67_8002193 [Cordylochernes scorpioides]